jgi:hypothetical protein
VLDGAHAAEMARVLRAWIEDPVAHFDPIPVAPEGRDCPAYAMQS